MTKAEEVGGLPEASSSVDAATTSPSVAGSVAGHTPGPWHVAGFDANGQPVVMSDHTEVATCWHHCVGSLEVQARGNAKLIAAAPELLCALRSLMAVCDVLDVELGAGLPVEDRTWDEPRSLARAALAKATGQ